MCDPSLLEWVGAASKAATRTIQGLATSACHTKAHGECDGRPQVVAGPHTEGSWHRASQPSCQAALAGSPGCASASFGRALPLPDTVP